MIIKKRREKTRRFLIAHGVQGAHSAPGYDYWNPSNRYLADY